MDSTLNTALQHLTHAFLQENERINLSALRTEDACWHGNVLDSLPFLELIEKGLVPKPDSMLDVGTGGGFPLLPLAIALPDTMCTGLDSTAKKLDAIARIAEACTIQNVHSAKGRAETLGQDPLYREQFDVVTARAVAKLPELLECTVPFAKKNGHIVLWKSTHSQEELESSKKAQQVLGCQLVETYEYDLGEDWGKRLLLLFKKTMHTPKQYPRPVGIPKKDPLQVISA